MKKTALITGSSKGIGKELSLLFLQKGYTVFGYSRTNSIKHKNFYFNQTDLSRIKNLEIMNIKKHQSNNFFSNKIIVFTGTLKKLSREEAKHLANDIGAKISSNISKNTDFLIIGENPGSKEQKAKEFNIKVLNEEDWIKKINQ